MSKYKNYYNLKNKKRKQLLVPFYILGIGLCIIIIVICII